MGQLIEFASNGGTAAGYLAAPAGKGPGVIVIQEWWGLVDHIKDVADRFAAEGYVALAPDLYHGQVTKEPDEAQKMMMQLDIAKAGQDMAGAHDWLRTNPMVEGNIGSVGFCMGGALCLFFATLRPIKAAVSFYGLPTQEPDWSAVQGSVLIHVAEHDDWVTEEGARLAAEKIRSYGQDAQFHVYADTNHAFFNDSRPEVYAKDAAGLAWERTIETFRRELP